MPETADHSSPADPSRRAVLRGATALGALLALSALPEFTPRAAAAPRPPLSLVPADRAVLLRYSSPGAEGSVIEQGLPVGNGRLGALTTGGSSRDAFYLTDATLWTGHANAALDSAGQFPYDAGSFGTFGLLAKAYLDLPTHTSGAISGYRRTLDLSNGLVTASYTQGGTTYTREVYASVPDDVVVIRLAQSGGGSYTGSLTLTGTRGESVTAEAGAARVSFAAGLANSLRYAAVVQAAGTGGTLSASGAEVTFTGCSEVVLVVSGGTDYKADHATGYRDAGVVPLSVARTKAEDAAAVAGTALLASHVADHRRLQERMTVDLGASTPAQRAMDTPERLAARAAGATPDPELEAAYLQFGRYLTIRGSRGSLPTNLQGLWVDRNNPDWMADYHTDVNVQMNYWLPDRAGLPECFDAFTDYCLAQLPGWTATTQASSRTRATASATPRGRSPAGRWRSLPTSGAATAGGGIRPATRGSATRCTNTTTTPGTPSPGGQARHGRGPGSGQSGDERARRVTGGGDPLAVPGEDGRLRRPRHPLGRQRGRLRTRQRVERDPQRGSGRPRRPAGSDARRDRHGHRRRQQAHHRVRAPGLVPRRVRRPAAARLVLAPGPAAQVPGRPGEHVLRLRRTQLPAPAERGSRPERTLRHGRGGPAARVR
ncbi:glycoside hydrolase N-terminal domain-containing protein [Streptomyces sp. MA15]|uniref:glycosyl hydrolase family 95 catalytic domain-containing protein n=1 Tax=Streptomyces sp. MA15 TaxID=3055061 RepID=UPI0025B0CD04|nr:glycoside hydrolase N-terminal domain-containing protein [Streptomyces sp. MA15]MDN3272273.1 glycoside hydrolase N-terminal domain-containing protein [Streptomyces sp. MA15]